MPRTLFPTRARYCCILTIHTYLLRASSLAPSMLQIPRPAPSHDPSQGQRTTAASAATPSKSPVADSPRDSTLTLRPSLPPADRTPNHRSRPKTAHCKPNCARHLGQEHPPTPSANPPFDANLISTTVCPSSRVFPPLGTIGLSARHLPLPSTLDHFDSLPRLPDPTCLESCLYGHLGQVTWRRHPELRGRPLAFNKQPPKEWLVFRPRRRQMLS